MHVILGVIFIDSQPLLTSRGNLMVYTSILLEAYRYSRSIREQFAQLFPTVLFLFVCFSRRSWIELWRSVFTRGIVARSIRGIIR